MQREVDNSTIFCAYEYFSYMPLNIHVHKCNRNVNLARVCTPRLEPEDAEQLGAFNISTSGEQDGTYEQFTLGLKCKKKKQRKYTAH